MSGNRRSRTAIVLSGGGTRGAYEAGVINYLRTKLPPDLARRIQFRISCGSSVGAINAVWMAATAHDPIRQGTELVQLWRELRTENIYRGGALTLGKLLLRTLAGITAHVFGIEGWKRRGDRTLHFQGFFDTQPFFHFLRQGFTWSRVGRNLKAGLIDAVAVAATNMATGEAELFLQARPDLPLSKRIITHHVKLAPRHLMASAALPLLFPPVPIRDVYYNDGGLRLNTPLGPAVSLGADRILVIGTHFRPRWYERDTLGRLRTPHFPTLAEVLGKVFHSLLADRLIADREQVTRINRILDCVARNVPPEAYDRICEEAGVRNIEEVSIYPSVDIATLVDETVRGSLRNLKSFSSLERALLRVLEADPDTGVDLLSYFLFEPTYLRKLIDLGYEDARSRHDALSEFAERAVANTPAP